MKIETTDLYHSAYLMAKGIPLSSMSILNGSSRAKIIFIFTGSRELGRLNQGFEQGKALINPIDLKKSILHLKDLMYDKMRTYQEERRYKHAGHTERRD